MATFKEAFKSARKAGKTTFMWNGNSYNTKLKEEVAGSGPKPRPKGGDASAPVMGPKARPRTPTPTAEYNARTMKKPDANKAARTEARAERQANADSNREKRYASRAARNAPKNDPKLMKAANQEGARRRLMEKGFAKGGMVKKDCGK